MNFNKSSKEYKYSTILLQVYKAYTGKMDNLIWGEQGVPKQKEKEQVIVAYRR